DASFAGHDNVFIRVDILDVNFWRKIRVEVQLILRGLECARLVEVSDSGVLLEAFDDFLGLIGKAVTLIAGGIEGFLITIGEDVGGGDYGDNDRNVGSRVSRVFR